MGPGGDGPTRSPCPKDSISVGDFPEDGLGCSWEVLCLTVAQPEAQGSLQPCREELLALPPACQQGWPLESQGRAH